VKKKFYISFKKNLSKKFRIEIDNTGEIASYQFVGATLTQGKETEGTKNRFKFLQYTNNCAKKGTGEEIWLQNITIKDLSVSIRNLENQANLWNNSKVILEKKQQKRLKIMWDIL
jgi:hypothetical protein